MNYYIVKPKEGYFSEELVECIVGADSPEEALDMAINFNHREDWRGWRIFGWPGNVKVPKEETRHFLEVKLLEGEGVIHSAWAL